MCLFVDDKIKNKIIINKKYITYKVLYKSVFGKDVSYNSIYYAFTWNIDILYKTEIIIFSIKNEHREVVRYEVNNGFHSYETLDSAKKLYDHLVRFDKQSDYVIVKCIIPKGSECYYGSDINDDFGYASNQLKIVEVIKK